MGQFGKAAVKAVTMLANGEVGDPRSAWERAISHETHSESVRSKSCTKVAFLTLCELGLVRDVPIGIYAGSSAEKKRAYMRAINALTEYPALAENSTRLWEIAVDGQSIRHNQEMDVLIALHSQRFIQ